MSPSNHKIMSSSMNTATTTMTSTKKMAAAYGGGGGGATHHHHHKDSKDNKDGSHAKGGGGGGGSHHHHRHHHSNNHHHNHNHNNNSTSTTATATTTSNPSHPNPNSNSINPTNNSNSKLSAYKADPYKTDFRRDVIAKRRELTKAHNLLQREKTQDRRLHGRVVSRNLVTIDTHKSRSNIDVLRMVIRDLGWREFPFPRRDHNCDVTWNAISFYDQPDIYSGQINKFPGTLEIFRKVNLFRWLEFMKNLFPEEYDFFPRTWLLPHQFSEFASEVRSMNEKKPKQKPVFIVKPSEGSQGEGIYLIRDPQHYTTSNGKTHVVQEYLNNVFLLEKFKFDFRVYVILRSLDPLEFHICREGLARFSTIPYEQPTKNNIHQTYMHLTNYSLNKKSPDFKISDKEEEGSKRKLLAVFKQMEKMGYDTEEIWAKIERLVAKTLIAVAGELKVEHQAAVPPGKPGPTCFQVLGFDILLVKSLDPILLEVNANPSLSITEEHESATGGIEYMISAKDEDVKRKLLRDTLILVAPKNKYTRKRRKYRRRRRHANYNSTNEEEDMDLDNPNNINNSNSSNNSSSNPHHPHHHRHHHQHRRRERDISIKYMDAEDERFEDHPKRNRSIFDEGPRKFVRNETCRVFIEGEGEVLFTEEGPSNPKYFSSYKDADGNDPNNDDTGNNNNSNNNNNNNNNKTGNSKSTGDTSDRLPSVFFKSGDRPADIIMEDDEETGDTGKPPRPIPFDLSLLESSDEDEEEEESCLKEISSLYAEKFKSQRIVERLSDIFIACLGVKGCLRLGPTMFRLFARKCRLNRKGITNAAIDILYIDMQRKWEYMNPDRTSGLSFLAFFSSCVRLAENSFYGKSKMEQIINFTEHCHRSLKLHSILEEEAEMRNRERSSGKNNNRSHSGSRRFPSGGGGVFKGESSGDSEDVVIWSDTVPLDDMQNIKISSTDWPELLNASFDDRTFMAPHRKHKNVFHMLQSIKR